MLIEEKILNYLKKSLQVEIYLEMPKGTTTFVLVEKLGSSNVNHLKTSLFAFQSYANSLYEAAILNEKVKLAIESIINLEEISKVKLNGDYNHSDTSTKRYRYQAIYELTHY